MCELTFPSGLIYIGILIVMVIIIVVQAMANANQKHELEYLRSRRSIGKKDEATGTEAEKVQSVMQAKIDSLKEDLRNAEIRCELMQSTIRKLRTGKGENQNDERS